MDQLEASIATLREEIDMRKAAVADKEALLANHNPPVFQAVQVSSVPAHHSCLRSRWAMLAMHSMAQLAVCMRYG